MRSLAPCVRALLAAALLLPLALAPLCAADPPPPLPTTKVNPIDGAEMILIPAGTFQMGTSEADLAAWLKDHPTDKREWFAEELPQHTVDLDAYYVYKTEVTVAQYRKFCDATKRAMPAEPDWKWQDTHPIVNVTWNDAKAYADWAGATLPTEAQWEKAARGGDGRPFPWGFTWDAAKCANFSNSGAGDTPKGPHSVGSFPAGASPYGALDMAGNVWEWCADWYGADYYKNAAAKNPAGPDTGKWRALRGGGWYISDPGNLRAGGRYNYVPLYRFDRIGFRCVVRSPGL